MFIVLLIIGIGFLCWSIFTKEKILKISFGIVAAVCIISAFFLRINSVEAKCKNAQIAYELVETTAEFTDKSEEDVYEYFVVASENGIEPYDAIQDLDKNLTNEQIMSIITLSDLRQERKEN